MSVSYQRTHNLSQGKWKPGPTHWPQWVIKVN